MNKEKSKALLTASCELTIYFYDVDPMNVVWHGNYARFFEQARSKLFDLIGYNYKEMENSGYLWPIVAFQVKYKHPIFLQQTIVVEAHLLEYINRLKIKYCILDSKSKKLLTQAESIQVAVKKGQNILEFESPMVCKNLIEDIIND